MSDAFSVTVIIATFGHTRWQHLARTRAAPSVLAQDVPFQLIELHEDEGTLAQVRNNAAEGAVGDWLCFLDSDDELALGYLAAMEARCRDVRALIAQAHALLVPAVSYVQPNGSASRPCIPDWGRRLIEVNCAVIGTLIPREAFLEAGGFRELPIYEDWELFLRLHLRHGLPLVDVCDAVYRAHAAPGVGVGGRNVGPAALETYRSVRAEYGALEPKPASPPANPSNKSS